MTTAEFFQQLEARIAKYDLLCHPFYKAWSAGRLTREDLREYAQDYFHHVEAFPSYLAALGLRLEDGELRRAVLANMCDEKGSEDAEGKNAVPHSDLWLDFAEGMGSTRNLEWHSPVPGDSATDAPLPPGSDAKVLQQKRLAAFYTYESQVPRIAQEKERGLRDMYGADDKTCGYFSLHATADVYHSRVWKKQLEKRLRGTRKTLMRRSTPRKMQLACCGRRSTESTRGGRQPPSHRKLCRKGHQSRPSLLSMAFFAYGESQCQESV